MAVTTGLINHLFSRWHMAWFNAAAMEQVSAQIARWLVNNNKRIILIFLVITLVLLPFALSVRLDPGYVKSVPQKHPYMQTFREYHTAFGGGNGIVVALRKKSVDGGEAIQDPEFLRILSDVTDDVFFLPGVNRPSVRSLFTPNVNFVAVTEDGFRGGNIVPSRLRANPEKMAPSDLRQVRENLLKSDEVGRLVSSDFNGALVTADVQESDGAGGQLNYSEFAEKLENIRRSYSSQGVDVAIIGFPKFIGEVMQAVERGWQYFILALLVTLLMLRVFIGRWVLSICALVVAMTAVVWQLGVVDILGYGIDPLSVLVPFLIFSIGVSHAVQMCNAWVRGTEGGLAASGAAVEAFTKLFVPGTTALLGNAVGFAVVMVIDIPIIKELGVIASVGVAVMIVTNKLLLPAVLSTLSAKFGKARNARFSCDSLFDALASLSRKGRSLAVVGGAVVLLGVATYGRMHLKIGDDGVGAPELYPDAQYNLDVSKITDAYAVGVDNLVVVAEARPESCTNYEVLSAVEGLERHLSQNSSVQSVVALPDYVKKGYVGNNEGYPKWSAIPREPTLVALAIRPIELSAGLFNADCSALPIKIYTKDHDAETIDQLVSQIKDYIAAQKAHGDQVNFRLALGNVGVMAAVNESIETAQLHIVLSLFVGTGLLCLATFFSWRASLCVITPLVISAMMCDAVMAWLGIGLKIPTLPVVALGVGVGVDYGIYLLARVMARLREGEGIEKACRYALGYAGVPIIFTAITMSFGVLCWLLSPLKFQADMALLLVFMFLFNMIGALVLIPALAGRLLTGHEIPFAGDIYRRQAVSVTV